MAENLIPIPKPRFADWLMEPMRRNKATYAKVALAAAMINIFGLVTSLFTMTVYDRVLPNNATESLIALEEEWGAHNYHPLPLVVSHAEGVWVYDVEGKRYLDCLSAYSAVNQGHCHPRLLAAFQEQASRVTLTSRAFRNDQLPYFCE